VTDVLRHYLELREDGRGHYRALERIAAWLGVDRSTAARVLERAQRAEGRRRA
jgi:hypothetical protein